MEPEARAMDERGDHYAEQWLYLVSPFGVWITSAILFAAMAGAYAVAAGVDHVAWIVRQGSGAVIAPSAKVSLCLALVVCSTLALQRYSRLKEIEDAPAFARALPDAVRWAPTFSVTRLRLFTLAGAVVALATIGALVVNTGAATGSRPATSLWLAVLITLVSVLFFRGVELTGAASRHTRFVIRNSLEIDLLRIERLYPWGRAAARTSLVWFTVSAAILLLFVGSGFTLYTFGIMLVCLAIGLWTFVNTLILIHEAIRAAKTAELESLRARIDGARDALESDSTAPARLQSLLAYEARIEHAPEWPFDQTVLVRVGASALILTVPWFGQAIAGLIVEHLGKLQS
jgi:hypothetical protein